jgi:membrane-associated phospholipid phosphatase
MQVRALVGGMAIVWTRPERLRAVVTLGVVLASALLLARGPMQLELGSIWPKLIAALVLTVLGQWYRHRGEEGLAVSLIGLAQLVIFTAAAASLNYALMPYTGPLMDPLLYALDQRLGIDWRSLYQFLKIDSGFSRLFTIAYASTLVQIAVIIPLLALMRRIEDLDLFMLAFKLAAVATVVFWAIFPSFGAGTYLFSLGEITDLPGAAVNKQIVQTLLALKSGEITTFSLAALEGLIAFPSFHTVMAILTVHAVRNIPLLFWPVGAWNVVVLLSVPTDGAHHVVDLVGGALFAWGAVLVSKRLLEPRPAVASESTAAAGGPEQYAR